MRIFAMLIAQNVSKKSSLLKALLGVTLFISLQGCTTRDYNAENSGSGVLLVGGASASSSQFPSVLQLSDQSCTAVKMGTRHLLTARHCVAGLIKGTLIKLQSGVDTASAKIKTATLDQDAVLHPTVDLAVLKLVSDPLNLPAAQLATQTPRANDFVTLVGYGCTDRNSTPVDTGGGVLTSGALNNELRYLVGPLSRVSASDLFYQASVSISSLASGIALPGLCPGDSGGPLWNNQNPMRVLGVNSSYHPSGESRFVRVDTLAANGVQSWIQNALN